MKYIFLLGLLIMSSGVGAQTSETGGFFNEDPTSPGVWYTNNNTSDQINKAPSSGLSGVNNAQPNNAGGTVNNAQPNNAGGSVSNIEKPTLTIVGFVDWILKILNYVAQAILTLALVFFLYGVLVLMFVDGKKEEARSQGRKFMWWGIVSLFVMVSVWGLVNVLKVSIFGPGDLILPRLK